MGFIENAMRAREARGRSPAFRAEMARENAEFMNVLNDLGKNTFDAGVGIILKTPTILLLNSFKAMHNEKYGMKGYVKDSFKLFFDKNGVAHKTIKVVANALHLVGQGAKIGVRQLFKV